VDYSGNEVDMKQSQGDCRKINPSFPTGATACSHYWQHLSQLLCIQKSRKRGSCICSYSLKDNWQQNRLDSVVKSFLLKLIQSSHIPIQKPRQITCASEESIHNSPTSVSGTDFTQEMKQDININET